MDSNSTKIHFENDEINGFDYIKRLTSMDPRQLHNEICADAENLRRKYGITDVSINPWFYHIPPIPPRDRSQIHEVNDLLKLYGSSGEDTNSYEEDRTESATEPESSPSSDSERKNKKMKPKTKKLHPSVTTSELPLEDLFDVNYAKEKEEHFFSLYGKDACRIKAKEDLLKINYTDVHNVQYWPCEPLNFRYALEKQQLGDETLHLY